MTSLAESLRQRLSANALNVVQRLHDRLSPHGFDVVHPLQLSWYHNRVPDSLHLPYRGDRLVVLIGNTKRIWKPFLSFLNKKSFLENPFPNPLNHYTETVLTSTVEDSFYEDPIASYIYWGHNTRPGHLVGLQHMAHAGALAFYENEDTFLCYHPEHGPWMALRACVVYDIEYDQPLPPPPTIPAAFCAGVQKARLAMKNLPPYDNTNEKSWRAWAKIRQLVGAKSSEYSEDQLRYHYTADPRVLERLLRL